MHLKDLLVPKGPWVHSAGRSAGEVSDALKLHSSEIQSIVFHLDGSKMRSKNEYDGELELQFEFPFYGRNADALMDCLTDLSWWGDAPDSIVVLISSPNELLSEAPDEMSASFVDVLSIVGEDWSKPKPEDSGEWWDRGPVAFHTVFCIDDELPERFGQISQLSFASP